MEEDTALPIQSDKDNISIEPLSQSSDNISNENQENETIIDQNLVREKDEKYMENVVYNDEGIAIYTDPTNNFKYEWSKETNQWEPQNPQATGSVEKTIDETQTDGENKSIYENEHYRWDAEANKWIPKENQTENEFYKWCEETKKWIPKETVDEDGLRTKTDEDGAVFFWDTEKNAWFPKIDDDFMAVYQMNYGFIDNKTIEPDIVDEDDDEVQKEMRKEYLKKLEEEEQKAAGVKRKADPPKWFEIDPENNTKVYVSNLPKDATDNEFTELMAKCGLIVRDPQTSKMKIKLYKGADGIPKGDGLCDYIRVSPFCIFIFLLKFFFYIFF